MTIMGRSFFAIDLRIDIRNEFITDAKCHWHTERERKFKIQEIGGKCEKKRKLRTWINQPATMAMNTQRIRRKLLASMSLFR